MNPPVAATVAGTRSRADTNACRRGRARGASLLENPAGEEYVQSSAEKWTWVAGCKGDSLSQHYLKCYLLRQLVPYYRSPNLPPSLSHFKYPPVRREGETRLYPDRPIAIPREDSSSLQ